MSKTLKLGIQYFLSLAIAILLFWYAVRNISFASVVSEFKRADYRWILCSLALVLISHLARAYRWRLLLAPLGYPIRKGPAFLAVMIGYFANLILPRMGEVTRCGMLHKMEGTPVNTALGTVITERIIDVIILFALVGGVFFLEFDRLSGFLGELMGSRVKGFSQYSSSSYVIFFLLGLGILILIGFLLYKRWQKLQHIGWVLKTKNFLKGLGEGILSIKKVEKKFLFWFYTFVIWGMYYAMSYVLFFCFPQTSHLDVWAGATILIMGGIGMAAPVQGGIGAYHLLVSGALALYGLGKEEGILFATFMHTIQTLIVIVVGGLCFLISLLVKKQVAKDIN